MNYTVISPHIMCNRCNYTQKADSKYCSACGCSFVFSEPDAWSNQIQTTNKTIKEYGR